MNEVMITIPLARYEELLKAEAKIQFMTEYALHETMGYRDIKYYLGIKEEEESDDKD